MLRTSFGSPSSTGILTSHYLTGYFNTTLWYWDLAAPDSGLFYLTSTDGGITPSFAHAASMTEVPDQLNSGYATMPFDIVKLMVADHDGTYGYTAAMVASTSKDGAGQVQPETSLTVLKVELTSGTIVAQTTAIYPATRYPSCKFHLSTDGSLLLAVGADAVLAWSTKDLSPHAPATAPDLGGLTATATGDYVVVGALTEPPTAPTTADLTVYSTHDWKKVATSRGAVSAVAVSCLYAYDQEAATWSVADLGTGKAVDMKDPLPTGDRTQVCFSNGYVIVRSDAGLRVREPGSPTALLSWMATDGRTVPVTANVYGGYPYALNAGQTEFQIYNLATGELLMPAGGGLSYVNAPSGQSSPGSLTALRQVTEHGAVYEGSFYMALGWQDL